MITTICVKCRSEFKSYPSAERKYCSTECIKNNNFGNCETCKKRMKILNYKNRPKTRFCSKKCVYEWRKKFVGELHHCWKGGRNTHHQGYIQVHLPRSTKWIMEHRLIMEKHLGRKLERHEWVHHKNGDKKDNRLENLQIVTHIKHHHEVKCPHCLEKFLIH